jgi:putative ABC transport system permease protein
MVLLCVGAAFDGFLEVGAEAGGDRWLMVEGEYSVSRTAGARPGDRIVLETEDLERLQAGVASATAIAAEIVEVASVSTPRRTRATVVSAASPSLDTIQNHRIARGRWLEPDDDRGKRHVAVLGHDLVEPFFGDREALGGTLQIEGVPFDVVGIMRPKGFQLVTHLARHDEMVFVPLSTGQSALRRGDEVDHLLLDPLLVEESEVLHGEVVASLAPLHHIPSTEAEAFSFYSVPEMLGPVRKVGVALQLLMGAIGTVTLAMAGVGVANLMTAIASGRRREFAMRRACGARRGDVVLQLLVESVVVVGAAGLLGVLLGLALVGGLAVAPLPDALPRPRIVPGVVFTCFVVLVGTGLSAGVVPARLASRVDPGAALRAN